jgi:high-affinity nickel-transport protein
VLGLDERIAGLGGGGGVAIVLLLAVLLGLRHATDPDHLTAVSTLVMSERDRRAGRAALLGLAWGLGHATTLLALGVPALLVRRELPGGVERIAEAAIGVVIIALAARLLLRWRRGYLHTHAHRHGGRWHAHPHAHEGETAHAPGAPHGHPHAEALGRSPLAAYAIGTLHGVGGSAGVTLLVIAAVPQREARLLALVLFASATAGSMAVLSAGFGRLLGRLPSRPRMAALTPAFGSIGLAFGVWYTLAAVSVGPFS